jgi:REP element-mobilizing transposase RayT
MTYDPEKHHRKSIRLKEYDYSKPNAYFITICTYNKECIFGAIINGEMQLNAYGKIVENEWLKTPAIRPYVLLDKYIIMPNHFHGIIIIDGVAMCRDTAPVSSRATEEVAKSRIPHIPTFEQFGRPTSHSIPTIIRSFKAATTKQIREIQKTHRQTVWQPRFYEHIIRNPHELDQTREYIINNPLKWELDSENPDKKI